MTKRTCSVRYFCFGSLLIFGGSILLCALGFIIVLPHQATIDWPQVMCNVTYADYDITKCACKQHLIEYDNCMSKYPCLRLNVSYVYTPKKEHKKEEVDVNANTLDIHIEDKYNNLHDNIHNNMTTHSGILYRYWTDAFHKSCSLYECGDDQWNIKEVRRFKSEYGTSGLELPCYLDPSDPHSLVMERTPTADMIHAILWPSIALFIGSVIWMGVCCGFWKIEMEPEHEKYTPQSPYGIL